MRESRPSRIKTLESRERPVITPSVRPLELIGPDRPLDEQERERDRQTERGTERRIADCCWIDSRTENNAESHLAVRVRSRDPSATRAAPDLPSGPFNLAAAKRTANSGVKLTSSLCATPRSSV